MVVHPMVICPIVYLMRSFKFWMIKNPKVSLSTNCLNLLKYKKTKVECVLNFLQNAKNIAFRHGFDQFNSPMVSHNGCKGATKDTKHENKGAKK